MTIWGRVYAQQPGQPADLVTERVEKGIDDEIAVFGHELHAL